MSTRVERAALAEDARNRGLRSLVQGLGVTALTTLVMGLVTAIATSQKWEELWATLTAFSFFQTFAVSVLSWWMRARLDGSSIPTPLPPAPVPPPNQDNPEDIEG